MAKQVCDIQAGKGMSVSQSDEHLRKATNAIKNTKWSSNYDPTREHLNFEIGKGGVVKEIFCVVILGLKNVNLNNLSL